MSVFDRDTIAMRRHAKAGVVHMVAIELAEEFAGLLLHLFFFFGDVWNYVAQNVERGHAGIARAAHGLHGRYEERLDTEFLMQRSERDHQANGRTVGIGDDIPAGIFPPSLPLDQSEVFGVDLGDDQGNILLHAKGAKSEEHTSEL